MKLNGKQLIDAFISGSNAMSNNKDRIDSMNVFPVPDGDTGSNMGASIEYAIDELKNFNSEKVGEVANKFARGLLLGARGNSGVILSQIFKGFSVALEDKIVANQFDIVNAFDKAREYAYKSVMKPVEGTILTVIRMVHENLAKTITPNHTIADTFSKAKDFAREACDSTPQFLPVLKEVGVTDSGGEGLFVILEGISSFFEGKPVKISDQAKASTNSLLMDDEVYDGEFGYCTEFIIDLKSHKSFKKDRFSGALEKMGNSMVVVQDEEILKTHIHSKKPGAVLSFAQKFGEFQKIKIDNMSIQASQSKSAKQSAKGILSSNSEEKLNIAVISCNSGSGIIDEMKELGTDFIIEGGQSSNPSAQDFIQAIESINSDKIILLPNNKNIILVAQQVAQTSEKEIIVVPTKTQVEGIVAMMNFDRTASIHENDEMMHDSISDVKTGQVTKAARTTKIEGVHVTEGEYLAIAGKKILKSVPSKVEAGKIISKSFIDDDVELVTIYFGNDATKSDAEELLAFIETHYDVEVEIKNGNQPTYDFLIAYE